MASRIMGYRCIQVLGYVRAVIDDEGRAPSYSMIRDELGFTDKGDVCRVVKRLEQRGLLHRAGSGRVRRIRLPTHA
jgi:SOS-response transcriptional repressor LexA